MCTRPRSAALLLAAALGLPIGLHAQPADRDDAFVNRVWVVVAASGVAPGALYVFLSDGTLVITSGNGTDAPGVGRWSRTATGLELVEEGRPYPTEILEAGPDRFRIRIANPGTPTEITFAPAPHRTDGPGDPGPGSITPIPTRYTCGGQTYRIAFETGAAYVTLPDGRQLTLRRLARSPDDAQRRTYTDGRLTVAEDARAVPPTVTVARGRMAPLTCRHSSTLP